MKGQIALITILTDDVHRLANFYQSTLGFHLQQDLGQYVELVNPGVRFAICARSVMESATGNPVFHEPRSGQSFELAFPLASAAELDQAYADIVGKGATPLQPPADMPWNQRTAFFADPDGNIHELFTDLG
jgi:catechol 2,3-dioxygenase-like lactoylglutathione lyase family enzyme